MNTPNTLGTAAKLRAHADRILGGLKSKQESGLLDKIDKLETRLHEAENVAHGVGLQKSQVRLLDGAERRALSAVLTTGETFPPPMRDIKELAAALSVLCRFSPELLEQRVRYLTGKHQEAEAACAPIRSELLALRDELSKVQRELQNA